MADKDTNVLNKNDFISRDEFANHLADIQFGEAPTGRTGENIDYQNGVYAGFDMAYVALKQFPAADVRQVVKASWKKDNSYPGPGLMNLRCSVCGGFGGTWKDNTLPSMLYNFCPTCGAYMEKMITGKEENWRT